MKCPHCNGTGTLDAPHYGDLVHAQRRARGMTQQDVAEKAGISRAQIANMEAGRTDIPLKTLARIASAQNAA